MMATDERDAYLTIVPEETDESYRGLDTIVDDGRDLPRPVFAGSTTPKTPPRLVSSPYAPAATPAPAPSRLPVAVAGLVGGVMIGGAGVAVLCALLMGTVTAAGAATDAVEEDGVLSAAAVAPVRRDSTAGENVDVTDGEEQ